MKLSSLFSVYRGKRALAYASAPGSVSRGTRAVPASLAGAARGPGACPLPSGTSSRRRKSLSNRAAIVGCPYKLPHNSHTLHGSPARVHVTIVGRKFDKIGLRYAHSSRMNRNRRSGSKDYRAGLQEPGIRLWSHDADGGTEETRRFVRLPAPFTLSLSQYPPWRYA